MHPPPHGSRGGSSTPHFPCRREASAAQPRRPGPPKVRSASVSAAVPAADAAVCLSLRAVTDPSLVRRGPAHATVFPNGHDRSLLCIDVGPSSNYCATGSADGGIRIFNLGGQRGTGGLVCELYGVTWGHSDWVTSCAFSDDGRLLSGAMDGKICLWPQVGGVGGKPRPGPTSGSPIAPEDEGPPLLSMPQQQQQQQVVAARRAQPPERTMVSKASTNRIRCKELGQGHRAGVSQVSVRGSIGASCGYDGSLRLWCLDKAKELGEYPSVQAGAPGALGALAPLLQFVWLSAFAAAGSKKGAITVWDLNKGMIAATIPSAHRGAVGDIQLLLPPEKETEPQSTTRSSNNNSVFSPLLVTGGRADGRLCVFDLRCLSSPVYTAQAHSAAVNSVLPLGMGGGALGAPVVSTVGADGCCKAWDLRATCGHGNEGASKNLLGSIHAGRGGFLCGAVVDDRQGLVCTGSADGAVYLLDLLTAAAPGGPPNQSACWGYGCDSRGAVQTVKVVSVPPTAKGQTHTSVALLAGGDDGHLACLKFG